MSTATTKTEIKKGVDQTKATVKKIYDTILNEWCADEEVCMEDESVYFWICGYKGQRIHFAITAVSANEIYYSVQEIDGSKIHGDSLECFEGDISYLEEFLMDAEGYEKYQKGKYQQLPLVEYAVNLPKSNVVKAPAKKTANTAFKNIITKRS